MPFGDGTGPWWGQGRGWRCWRGVQAFPGQGTLSPVWPSSKEDEASLLDQERAGLQARLSQVEARLKELKK